MGVTQRIIEGTMERVSQDYLATGEASYEMCGRSIYPSMYVFQIELRGGRRGVAHSLCENLKKLRWRVEE